MRCECACERRRARRGRPAAPTAAGAERAAGQSRRAGAQGAGGDKGRDTRSPPPASSLGWPSLGGTSPSPPGRPPPRRLPGCPRRSRGASCSCCISRAGAATGGCRAGGLPGAAAARASPSPPLPPGPLTQLPGLGGCDNGL